MQKIFFFFSSMAKSTYIQTYVRNYSYLCILKHTYDGLCNNHSLTA